MASPADEKLTEQALRETFLRDLVLRGAGGMFQCDQHGVILRVDSSLGEMLGYQPGELAGLNIRIACPAQQQGQLLAQLGMLPQLRCGFFECQCQRRDGSVFWAEMHLSQQEDACILGLVRDISERRQLMQIQEEKRRWEIFARSTLDALPEHICVVDGDGVIIAVNRAWREFGSSNGATPQLANEGINYLAICERAARQEGGHAAEFLQGIRDVIAGRCERFAMEYPCDSPLQQRWFAVRVSRFDDDGPLRLVIAHDDISQRKQTEVSLRHSEVRFRSIVETAQEGVWVLDIDARTTFVNHRIEQILGYGAVEMLGRTMLDFMDEQARSEATVHLQQWGPAFDGEYEFRFLRKDGSSVWAQLTCNPLPADNDSWQGALVMVTDITQRHYAAAALRASEERFFNAFEYAATGMALVALDGSWLKINTTVCDLLGYTRNEFFARSQRDITHPDDLNLDQELAQRLLDGEIPFYHIEKRFLHKQGHVLWILLAISLVRDRAGAPLHYIVQAQDISAHVLAEAATRRQASLQGLIAEFSQLALAHSNIDALLEQAVQVAARGLEVEHSLLLEFQPDGSSLGIKAGTGWQQEWHARTVHQLDNTGGSQPPQSGPAARTGFRALDILAAHYIHNGIDVTIEGLNRSYGILGCYAPAGRAFSAEEISFLHSLALTVATALERRQAQEARIEYLKLEHRRNQEHYRLSAMLERSKDEVVIITDPEGRIEFVNGAFSRLTGYDESEMAGRTPEFLHAEGASSWHALWQIVLQHNEWKGRLEYRGKNRRTLVLEATISPVRDNTGAITGYVTVGTDITYQQQLESRLLRDEKLKSLGYLAAGIAHDFNNILNVILGNAELTALDLPEGSMGCSNLQQVNIAVERGRTLVDQLLTFARQEQPRFSIISLAGLVGETAKLMRPGLPSNIALQVSIDPEAPEILADPVQLRQIILNLATNAVHALNECGGTLQLQVAPQRRSSDGELDQVRLVVRDNGGGIDPEVLDRIFDPFFTTRDVGEGTGLGLSVVHGIVERHGGRISVESEPGRGSCFTVLLPVVPPYAVDETPPPQ